MNTYCIAYDTMPNSRHLDNSTLGRIIDKLEERRTFG